MPHLVTLRLQVSLVDSISVHFERDSLYNLQPITVQANHFLGIVGKEFHLPHSQVSKYLGPNAVITKVGPEAELLVCLNCVEAFILQLVRFQFVEQSNTSA